MGYQSEYAVDASLLQLVFGGDMLEDSQTVQELGLENETGSVRECCRRGWCFVCVSVTVCACLQR